MVAFVTLCEAYMGIEPHFNPLNEWRKIWFFLRNNTDVLLPGFTGSRPIPQPNWGYGVAQKDLRRLQPLWEVIRKFLKEGLMGAELLQTFFSHRVQLLHWREVTKWMYPRPNCPGRSFSVELSDIEINTQIQGVLAHGLI
jgi:hypothetical protein